jgi:hypothetical protein
VLNLTTSDQDLIGEFHGSAIGVGSDLECDQCTLRLYSDHLDVSELGLRIDYESIKEVLGGGSGDFKSLLTSEEFREISKISSNVVIVKFRTLLGQTRVLALSWESEGVDGIDYFQIMLYRAYAASRVRSKNNGAPCYGILGY